MVFSTSALDGSGAVSQRHMAAPVVFRGRIGNHQLAGHHLACSIVSKPHAYFPCHYHPEQGQGQAHSCSGSDFVTKGAGMDSVRETDPAEMSPAALAWYGNAAKMRIMERLIADRTPRIVFDCTGEIRPPGSPT